MVELVQESITQPQAENDQEGYAGRGPGAVSTGRAEATGRLKIKIPSHPSRVVQASLASNQFWDLTRSRARSERRLVLRERCRLRQELAQR